MSKIELTISTNYVPTWTYLEAVRELFQNALDQEAQNSDNAASWQYDETTGTLTICNATSKLTTASLLLGQTTKADDESTIGQFGEGYKIATLVLLREGKGVTFYNYGAREIWRPRFVKSRRFGTDILTFFTEKPAIWERVPSADLSIVVTGITTDEYAKIVESNLHLRDDYEVLESNQYGEVINLPGKVYVNGLYVCDYKPYRHGYNFKPEYISLDRDRKMVSDFDLCWMASKMWSLCKDSDKVLTMVEKGYDDVAYLEAIGWLGDWYTSASKRFQDTYGSNAVPVSTQEDFDQVPEGYKGIIVNSNYCEMIKKSPVFTMPEPDTNAATSGLIKKLQAWFGTIQGKLSYEEVQQFDAIMAKLQDRLGGTNNE